MATVVRYQRMFTDGGETTFWISALCEGQHDDAEENTPRAISRLKGEEEEGR